MKPPRVFSARGNFRHPDIFEHFAKQAWIAAGSPDHFSCATACRNESGADLNHLQRMLETFQRQSFIRRGADVMLDEHANVR